MRERYHGGFYARALNMTRALTAAYDRALEEFDLLLMPTQTAHEAIPPAEGDRKVHIGQVLNMVYNTCPFDLSGHPAATVPCHDVKGLPVSLCRPASTSTRPRSCARGMPTPRRSDTKGTRGRVRAAVRTRAPGG